MKETNMTKAWDIVYPVGIYFVVTVATLFILDFIIPGNPYNNWIRQLISYIVALPFLYSFYRRDTFSWRQKEQKEYQSREKSVIHLCIIVVLLFLAGGCFAAAWNNVLGWVHLSGYSVSYQKIEETFYIGKIIPEILAFCIAAPLAEELLYRGIVYRRTKNWLGTKTAIVVSALIFGLVHLNLVQFVYASVFGLLLAYILEKTGKLYSTFILHAAANCTSLFRGETNMFSFLDQCSVGTVILTFVLFLAAACFLYLVEHICSR